ARQNRILAPTLESLQAAGGVGWITRGLNRAEPQNEAGLLRGELPPMTLAVLQPRPAPGQEVPATRRGSERPASLAILPRRADLHRLPQQPCRWRRPLQQIHIPVDDLALVGSVRRCSYTTTRHGWPSAPAPRPGSSPTVPRRTPSRPRQGASTAASATR